MGRRQRALTQEQLAEVLGDKELTSLWKNRPGFTAWAILSLREFF